MEVKIYDTPDELGLAAASFTADLLNRYITDQGYARLLLSTGASQLSTLGALVQLDVDWSRVEAFHLDEYIGLPIEHTASFRKYLQEKLVDKVDMNKMHFVETDGDVRANIRKLTDEIREKPIDVALIGVGENTHIAFNDPPANFDTKEAYIIVNLDIGCKQQQVREGWFSSIKEVPSQAVTMTPYQIMQSKTIVSCVPFISKANAVKRFMYSELTNQVPATLLKTHSDFTLFLDKDSASLLEA